MATKGTEGAKGQLSNVGFVAGLWERGAGGVVGQTAGLAFRQARPAVGPTFGLGQCAAWKGKILKKEKKNTAAMT